MARYLRSFSLTCFFLAPWLEEWAITLGLLGLLHVTYVFYRSLTVNPLLTFFLGILPASWVEGGGILLDFLGFLGIFLGGGWGGLSAVFWHFPAFKMMFVSKL